MDCLPHSVLPMKPQIGIAHAAYYLPGGVRDVSGWATRTGAPRHHAMQLGRAGAHLYRDAAGESVLTMAATAVKTLLDETALEPASIDCLVYTHTLQMSVAPPPLSLPRLLCCHCGLARAEAFSFSQQHCASLLAALRIIRAMFAARPALARVLLVGADAMPYEPDRSVNGAGLMSDGAAAALIARNTPANRLAALATHTRADDWRGALAPVHPLRAAQELLDARALIRQVCAQAGLEPHAIGRVLPHHLDLPGWRRLLASLDIPPERLYVANFARIGHASVSDALINLRDCTSLQHGEPVLLFASGVGGFSAAALLLH